MKNPSFYIRKLRREVYMGIAVIGFFGLLYFQGRGIHTTTYTLPDGSSLFFNQILRDGVIYSAKGSNIGLIIAPVIHTTNSPFLWVSAVISVIGVIGMIVVYDDEVKKKRLLSSKITSITEPKK